MTKNILKNNIKYPNENCQYKLLFENTVDYIYVIDSNYEVVSLNRSAHKLLSTKSKNIIGQRIDQIFPKAVAYGYMLSLKKVFETGKALVVSGSKMIFNNKNLYLSVTLSPIKDNKGKVAYVIGVSHDITPEVILQKEIEEQENDFKNIVDSIFDGVILADIKTKKFYLANKSICKMLGYSEKELLKLGIKDIHPKQRLQSIYRLFDNLVKGNIRIAKNVCVKRKDGTLFYADISSSNIVLKGKTYSVGVFRDISSHKFEEDRLRESEEKFRNLFNNSEIGMFRTRLDGSEVLDANEKFLSLLGFTRTEFVGRPSTIVWADPKERKEMVKMLKKHNYVHDFEFKLMNKFGEIKNCITSLVLYPETGILEGSIQDITDRKRIEQKIKESEEKYRRLFETARDSILILDADTGEITDSNPFIEELLGYSKKELVGKKIFEISPFKDVIENKEKFLELQKKGYVYYSNLPLQAKSGTIKNVEFVSNVYLVVNKEVVQCNIRDITKRIIKEKELEEAKSDFLSLTSHQLRTPLSATKWVLESLISNWKGCTIEQKEKLNDLVVSNERLINLVNKLMDITRIESGKLAVNKKNVNLKQIIMDVSGSIKTLADSKKKNIKIIEPANFKNVYCDPMLISESIENLLSNAINYSSNDSREIIIRVKDRPKDYLISVHNVGFISTETKEKIKDFKRFIRGPDALKVLPAGSGLGLYLTKKIIEAGGGTMWFESNTKSGTTFYVTIIKENIKKH